MRSSTVAIQPVLEHGPAAWDRITVVTLFDYVQLCPTVVKVQEGTEVVPARGHSLYYLNLASIGSFQQRQLGQGGFGI